jgi:predicted DNA-binding transcriptional regulator AlpA
MPNPKRNKQFSRRARHRQLLSKAEVLKRVGVSYPTLWNWMRQGKFPRSRVLGELGSKTARVVWFEDEIELWIAGLPLQTLKGDEAAL